MDISVIICTYNRAKSLEVTLNSLREMSVPEEISWEIIVVDNNSTDHTKEVVNDFINSSNLNCIYVFEKNQGLSYARNRGIKESKGEIIAFTDDDVIVDKYWVKNIYKLFSSNKDNIMCAGGKILPKWESPPPKWLHDDLYSILALVDLGDKPFLLDDVKIWGANLIFKREVFEKYGLFDTNLGRKKSKLYGYEECNLILKIIDNKDNVLYSPDLVVFHCINKNRLKKSYFRKWFYDNGELYYLTNDFSSFKKIFNVPLYYLKVFLKNLLLYIISLILSDQKNSFRQQLTLFYYLGIILCSLKSNNNF